MIAIADPARPAPTPTPWVVEPFAQRTARSNSSAIRERLALAEDPAFPPARIREGIARLGRVLESAPR